MALNYTLSHVFSGLCVVPEVVQQVVVPVAVRWWGGVPDGSVWRIDHQQPMGSHRCPLRRRRRCVCNVVISCLYVTSCLTVIRLKIRTQYGFSIFSCERLYAVDIWIRNFFHTMKTLYCQIDLFISFWWLEYKHWTKTFISSLKY